MAISIDYEKFNSDEKWDGLKGYLTNTTLDKAQVMDVYKELWSIEKAFRISKTDLQIRPVYHHLKRRIEAHICIAFTACKLYKELERQLKAKKASVECGTGHRYPKNHLPHHHYHTLLQNQIFKTTH